MADQKSRGGQKIRAEKQSSGKLDRDVHQNSNENGAGRDMKEDARRGQQSNNGGYGNNPDRE